MSKAPDIQERIIDACRKGDMKACYQLYTQHSKAMYNIAMRILNNKMDAEDVLQECFSTAFQRMGELKQPEAFPGWIRSMVLNRCISLQRKRRIHFEEIQEHLLEDEGASDELPEGISPARLHEHIKALPDGCRTVLVLHALEGYKHREVAQALGVSESTSKSQYHRALGLLRERIMHLAYE